VVAGFPRRGDSRGFAGLFEIYAEPRQLFATVVEAAKARPPGAGKGKPDDAASKLVESKTRKTLEARALKFKVKRVLPSSEDWNFEKTALSAIDFKSRDFDRLEAFLAACPQIGTTPSGARAARPCRP